MKINNIEKLEILSGLQAAEIVSAIASKGFTTIFIDSVTLNATEPKMVDVRVEWQTPLNIKGFNKFRTRLYHGRKWECVNLETSPIR